ncbi:MAG: hypothetical protein MI702_03020, partial [Chlorobiales bacterium]|nr:hypothetical protein [Chlorobiales bacterium]
VFLVLLMLFVFGGLSSNITIKVVKDDDEDEEEPNYDKKKKKVKKERIQWLIKRIQQESSQRGRFLLRRGRFLLRRGMVRLPEHP